MEKFTPLMNKSMERTLGEGIQLGAVFAEVSSACMGTQQVVDTP